MKPRLAAFAWVGWLLLCSVSCSEPLKNFPEYGVGDLRFSVDTLRFDTLFATVGSTTAWLTVYNAGRHTLFIESVRLKSGGSSGYRFSVDAYDSSHQGFSIPSGDSLFVFVEVTASPTQQPTPVLLEGALEFISSQGVSEVVLNAFSWDAVMWRGKRVTFDTILTATQPHVIYDSLVVEEGATLRIEPGATLCFHDGAALLCYGRIEAEGTKESPIVFRGDRLDKAFDDFPYDFYPGQWYGVYLGPNSYRNRFHQVNLHGAYYGIIADSSACLDSLRLSLLNAEISNMVYTCLYSVHSSIEVKNSVLANSGSYTMVLMGGAAEVVHSTIANYQRLVNRGDEPALAVVNYSIRSDSTLLPYPLVNTSFVNTIVYGSKSTEVGFGLLEKVPHDLSFRYCLLRSEHELPESMAHRNRYNQAPHFLNTGNQYRYDFRLDSLSAARDAADWNAAQLLPFDADGHDRLLDGKPDIGAFEWQAK